MTAQLRARQTERPQDSRAKQALKLRFGPCVSTLIDTARSHGESYPHPSALRLCARWRCSSLSHLFLSNIQF